jgi:hypothetical protein
MDGAGSALTNTAAVLCANQLKMIPEDPEQWGICRHINLSVLAVYMQSVCWHFFVFKLLIFQTLKQARHAIAA